MTSTNLYTFFGSPTQKNLESNQRGRLTDEQQFVLKKMVRQQLWGIVRWVVVLMILCGAFGFFFWAMVSDGLGPSLVGPVVAAVSAIAIVLLVMAVVLFPDLSFIFARDDIDMGQVETVLGKVEWTGRRYKIVSESRNLRTVRGNVSMPPPGEYRFYCLPNSGLVIQAEALMRSETAGQGQNLLLDALSKAHRFTTDDLALNRQGTLSGSQSLRLIGFVAVQGIMFLLFTGFGVWMYFNLPTSGEDQTWAIVFGVILMLLALGVVWKIFQTFFDLITRSVAHEEGYVIRTEHRTRNGRYYTYTIKKLKFRVSRNAFNALVDS